MEAKFKVGDKVRINPVSNYYRGTTANPIGIDGVIICISSDSSLHLPIQVKWDTGEKNTYDESDLDLIKEEIVGKDTFGFVKFIPKPTVNIINTSNNPLPEYKTEGSSGMDLYANEYCILLPFEIVLIKTGIFIEIPEGQEAQVRPRSGLALKSGVEAILGTIDSDYRGEVGVIFKNNTQYDYTVKKGDRIAQLVIAPVTKIIWNVVDRLSETQRGAGGFGSTGTK